MSSTPSSRQCSRPPARNRIPCDVLAKERSCGNTSTMSGPDLKVDVRGLTSRARRWTNKRVTKVEVNLGFIKFGLEVNDPERTAARELVFRLRDRRVLTAEECCGDCVRNSMVSLQEVRSSIVDAQEKLANLHDGQLFWLLDYILVTIRAFLTWEERSRVGQPHGGDVEAHYKDFDNARRFRSQLDLVRAHARVALNAIGTVAEVDLDTLPGPKFQDALARTAEPKYLLSDAD